MEWILEHGLAFGALLFATIIGAFEVGRRLGIARSRIGAPERQGSGAVEGAIFALLGLLVAFTFSGAASRFDQRRALIVEEANDIGTAWLRIDLMAPAAQPPLRDAFRRYVALRTTFYRGIEDRATAPDQARMAALQQEIWRLAVAGGSAPDARPGSNILMLQALNAMIDITTTRDTIRRMHPPSIIYYMLALLSLGGGVIGGFAMASTKTRNWFHRSAYALFMSVSIYVIIDLEFPRSGLIRLDTFDYVIANSIPPA